MSLSENQIELDLIAKLGDLKYTYRPDIRDRAALEANFREKFEALNRVKLTASEFVYEALRRRIFDGEALSELMAPLGLGWKARTQAELALVDDLTPLLHKAGAGARDFGVECV